MSRICFVSWEIHPVTQGGCGVFIHHAAEELLRRGHEVTLLLDMPKPEFEAFANGEYLNLPNTERCHLFHLDQLCDDFPWSQQQVCNVYQLRSLRFAHGLEKLEPEQVFDLIEFFEYCGAGYYSLARKLFRNNLRAPLVIRLHNSIEIIDSLEAARAVDRERYEMYAMERAGIDLAETILTPSLPYFEAYYRDGYGVAPGRVVVSQTPQHEFTCKRIAPTGRDPVLKAVCLGRVHPFKGVEQLIHAAVMLLRKRPDIPLEIQFIGSDTSDVVSGGSYIESLQRMIPQGMRARFSFIGHLTHERIAEELGSAAIAVFPNRFESFCYALHESYSAGVPVVINDIDGFREFFEHERNALVYDGTTSGLMNALERICDDPELRARLSCPYPVAQNPLGEFYDSPQVHSTLIQTQSSRLDCLAICIETAAGGATATLQSLAEQTMAPAMIIRASAADENAQEAVVWMGRRTVFRDFDGRPMSPLSIQTQDAILIVQSGDRLHETFMETCAGALTRRKMAFAGTWFSADGDIAPSMLDLAPEAWPVWNGTELTRALILTRSDNLLIDLFDPHLGPLGEIGYLWSAIGQWGRGCLLPDALVETTGEGAPPAEGRHMTYLLRNYGKHFGERLALLGTMMQQEYLEKLSLFDPKSAQANASLKARLFEPLHEKQIKRRIAESLGGLELMKLTASRWKTRKRRS